MESRHMESQGARSQFAGASQVKENSRNSTEATTTAMSDSIAHGKDAGGAAAKDAMKSAGSDLQSLQADLNGLKETVTKFMSEAAGQAAKTAREVSSQVTSRVSDVAGDLADRGSAIASTATDQAKTFASELEGMARRNPMGAIAGAVLVGIMIGVLGRRS
jgi:ElaB/YqjD/DUF883 family membrane-anchored ribosome-binding protein